MDTEISDLDYDDYKSDQGLALKISYSVNIQNGGIAAEMKQTIYALYIDNYSIIVTATDIGSELSPSVVEAAEYILDTVKAAK
jgi:hypothetical protein